MKMSINCVNDHKVTWHKLSIFFYQTLNSQGSISKGKRRRTHFTRKLCKFGNTRKLEIMESISIVFLAIVALVMMANVGSAGKHTQLCSDYKQPTAGVDYYQTEALKCRDCCNSTYGTEDFTIDDDGESCYCYAKSHKLKVFGMRIGKTE